MGVPDSECWLPVPDWEGFYEVSNTGLVRSTDRVIAISDGSSRRLRGRQIRPRPNHGGHLYISLSRPGEKCRKHPIHRLVLAAFVGPCPGGMEGCHYDGDPANNHLANLYWGTRSQNILDRFRHGWRPPGGKLRAQLDDLHNACVDTGEKLRGWVNLVDAHRFGLDWHEQWPVDESALMIAEWRAQRESVTA